MAGWSFIGIDDDSSAGTEGQQAVLTRPAGVQVGDLLLFWLIVETEAFGAVNFTLPAGVTAAGQDLQSVGSNGVAGGWFYRIADASDTPGKTYTFTWSHTATGHAATLAAYRGVRRDAPLQSVLGFLKFNNDSSGAIASNNFVPANATDLGVAAFGIQDGTSYNFTPPASATERTDFAGKGSGADDFLSLALMDDFEILPGSKVATLTAGTFDAGLGAGIIFNRNPSPDAPIVGAIGNFDATQAKTLSHVFSDGMAGDVQTARQWLIYRVSDGALVHDTGKVATATSDYVMAGGTLVNGNQYQAQVRVWDIDDNVSAYSGLQSFYTSAPPTATVTSPTAAQVIGASFHDIVVDYSDPEGEPKTAYRIVVTRTDVPGVLVDTGKALSADDPQTYRVTGLLNGGAYTIDAYVWDHRGIMSAVAQRSFTVTYAQPPKPVVTIDDNDGPYLQVIIANPAPGAGEVVAATNDLYRRVTGGAWVRIAKDLAVNVIYNDHAVASGQGYEYKARAKTGAGGELDSDPTATYSVTLDRIWIHDPSDSDATSWGFRNRRRARAASKKYDVALMHFEGRGYPVAEFGDALNETVSFDTLMFSTDTDLVTYRALVARKKTLCYRDSRGRKVFGVITDVTENDHLIGAEVPVSITATHYLEEV